MENRAKRNHKVLVVDDHPENIRIIGSILRENGFQVGFATGGQQALEILSQSDEAYNLVLLDVNMPGLNGLEVCKAMRKSLVLREIPVIFLTANTGSDQIVEGFASGGQDYVTKPFQAGELLARITTHIELRENREQLKRMNTILEERVRERTQELFEANQKLNQSYQELESLDLAKSEFLQLISHEINTPLNGILGFAQLLKEELASSQYHSYIDYLMDSANRLHQFSQDSLLITRIRTRPEKFEITTIEIRELIEELVMAFSDRFRQKNLKPKLRLSLGDHRIEGNDELIRTGLTHILRNAIHYSTPGGEIRIETRVEDQNVELELSDCGPGFSQIALQNMFKPFSPGEKHVDENKGLGLSLVKLIADFHKAGLFISNNEDGGARVMLRFGKVFR